MAAYSNWVLGQINGNEVVNWTTDTIQVSLFPASASGSITATNIVSFWSNISSAEITGTGYTASGMTLTSPSANIISTNPTVVSLSGASVSWPSSTISARYAVVWKKTSNPATSPCIAWVDFGTTVSDSSGTFTINWNTAGIVQFTSPDS